MNNINVLNANKIHKSIAPPNLDDLLSNPGSFKPSMVSEVKYKNAVKQKGNGGN